MELDIDVTGLKSLELKLIAIGKAAGAKIINKALRAGTRRIAKKAKANLSGTFKSLKRVKFSTRKSRTQDRKTFGVSLTPAKSFWFAHFFEGGVKPHEIKAKKKKVLSDGERSFGKKVMHPGLSATHFFSSAIESEREVSVSEFINKMQAEISKAAK